MNLLEILIDKDNTEPIQLTDQYGRTITFEQIAIIPLREDKVMYCILQPINTESKGIKEKLYAFRLIPTQDGEDVKLTVEENRKMKRKVFSTYKKLLKQKGGKNE